MRERGHIPVLGSEAVTALAPASGGSYVDATFGAGGYTELLLSSGARVYAFDRDPAAVHEGQEMVVGSEGRLTLIEAPFSEMEAELESRDALPVDGVVFDLGVSSMQLDRGERGFSFMRDGPLDMRMGGGASAADFLNQADEGDIADVIYQYGDERRSRRLARAIVRERADAPIETTGRLAAIAEGAIGSREKIHPATRLFQAVRILVNDELGQIIRGLIASERSLRQGGRLAAVTFHSLEDRIVKRFLQAASGASSRSRYLPEAEGVEASLRTVGRKAVAPSPAEVATNPRARSARLRIAERTGHAALDWTDEKLASLGAPAMTFSDLQRRWAA